MIQRSMIVIPDTTPSVRVVAIGAILAILGVVATVVGNDTPLHALAEPGVFATIAGLCVIVGGSAWAALAWLRAREADDE